MIIFTNCLTATPDEGCLKAANSIVKRIKKMNTDTIVVSYERKNDLSDIHVKSNKFLLTSEIIREIDNKENIFYIPFPARSLSTSIRILILSLIAKKRIRVLFTQVTKVDFISKILLGICRADYFVLSDDTKIKLHTIACNKRLKRIKAGVQTDKFVPVSKQKSDELKKKYGFDCDKPLVLHVGHLNAGRNIVQLTKLSENYNVLLVTSTLTKDEQDKELKNKLLSCPNIRLIDDYIPDIEEIYQMSDVYFFPVVEEGRCIDVPLSCLEAAACNKPVVTTHFGEMKAFKGKKGFWFIDSFDAENLNRLVEEAVKCDNPDSRSSVLEYDWLNAVNSILND